MAIPAPLSRTIHRTLGDEAGEDLINRMTTVEANRSELRELMESLAARTDGRFESMMARTDSRFESVMARTDSQFAEQRHWMEARFAEQGQRMAQFEATMERHFNDLLKWSFVFWCGAVGAVAMLARVLR